jgi:hypothetical protein
MHKEPTILRETLETPVEGGHDLIVFGAGSAGVAAAVAAARHGAKTMLVDPAGFVGGTLVSGLPILGCWDGEKQIVKGVFDEILDRLRPHDAYEGDPAKTTWQSVDPERLKLVLLEMLREAGVTLRLHTLFARADVEGGRIRHAVVEGKGGRRALAAPMFVDATGDADLARVAGVPTEKGRRSDGGMQAMTLLFAAGNVDADRFRAAGGTAYIMRLFDEWTREEGDTLRNPRRKSFSHFWSAPSRPGEFTFNVTRVVGVDGSDAASLSAAEVEGRLQVWEFLERFLKPRVAGFEDAYVVWTAAKIGVRETRRVVGEYVLTEDDVCSFRKFPDAVLCGSYPIDIHSPTGDGTRFEPERFYGGRYWTVPYRSLVPLGADNLLVAGRCLSATHEALSAVRCMANTLAMGQAAGTAAALSLREGIIPRTLDTDRLRGVLREDGVYLGE